MAWTSKIIMWGGGLDSLPYMHAEYTLFAIIQCETSLCFFHMSCNTCCLCWHRQVITSKASWLTIGHACEVTISTILIFTFSVYFYF